jgi:DNA polymerase-3 subunit alpha
MGLTVERPDVDESAADFTVTARAGAQGGKVIRFGLGAVKGVGSTAVDAVLDARKEGGAFNTVYDFCRRVDTQRCNRRVIEALVKSGAFDGVAAIAGLHRARLLGALDAALEAGAAEQRDRKSGQTSLFGLIVEASPAGGGGSVMAPEVYPDLEPWTAKQLLAFEKEALGFYISGHPLDRYRGDLSRYATATTSDFAEGRKNPGEASVGGIVAQYREMLTKKGDKMARFILEDQSGGIEVVCFPKTFEKVRHVLVCDEPILCTGKVQNEGTAEQSDWKILLENATQIAELRAAKTSRVYINLNADSVTREQINELKTILMAAPRGQCVAEVRLAIPQRSETVIALGERWMVSPSDELLGRLERVFGDRVATLA